MTTFDDFWALYDKKVGRRKCEAKWKRLKKTDRQGIAEHLPKYVENTPEKQYRKNPLTYLNSYAWEDEIIDYEKAKEKKVRAEVIKPSYRPQQTLEMSDEEKENIAYLNIIYCYDEWKQKGRVTYSYHPVYDDLRKRGLIKKLDRDNAMRLVEFLNEKYPDDTDARKMNMGKCHVVEDFFSKLKVHIKELL